MIDDILDYYQANGRDTSIVTEVKELFDFKYIQQTGDFGFDFTEGVNYQPQSKNFFIPGKIYTFFNKKVKKGSDSFPIILVTNVKQGNPLLGTYIEGINFNKIPPEYRATVLDSYTTKFIKEIELMWDAAEKGETYVSTKLIEAFQNPEVLNQIFDKYVGASYSRYYLSTIERPCLFEMDDWKFIPFYVDEGLDFGKMVDKFKSLMDKTASEAVKATVKKFKEEAKKKVKKLLKK